MERKIGNSKRRREDGEEGMKRKTGKRKNFVEESREEERKKRKVGED